DRPTALPRAFLLGGARVIGDAAARLEVLRDRGFDPRAAAILEVPPERPLPERGIYVEPVEAVHAVSSHALEFVLEQPGIAVLTESFDPGWSATVDGAPAAVRVVDHALLGVEVPAG